MRALSKKSTYEARSVLYSNCNNDKKARQMKKKMQIIDDSLLHIKNKMTMGQEKDLRTDKAIVTFKNPINKLNFE